MTELLYGKNPILEALRAGRRKFHRFFHLDSGKPDDYLNEALGLFEKKGVKVSKVSRDWFEAKIPGILTQGWAAEAGEYPYVDLEGLLSKGAEKQNSILLALDQVQDPQNLGAILRSAEGCGVDGVLLCTDRATHVTPAVCKASAGASEHLKIAKVVNLARAIELCQKAGFWSVGTDLSATEDALSFQWPSRTLLVLGSEGKGMRRLSREKCDFLIRLPLLGKISSLNVAATAAVCLYENLRSRKK